MYRVSPDRALCPAVDAPLERGDRPRMSDRRLALTHARTADPSQMEARQPGKRSRMVPEENGLICRPVAKRSVVLKAHVSKFVPRRPTYLQLAVEPMSALGSDLLAARRSKRHLTLKCRLRLSEVASKSGQYCRHQPTRRDLGLERSREIEASSVRG